MVFNKLLDYKKDAGVTSVFHFYSDLQKKSLKKKLFDPGYKINSKNEKFKGAQEIEDRGFFIGIHIENISDKELSLLEKKLLSI